MADIDAVMRDAVESLEYAVVALNARPQAHMRQVAEEMKEARKTVADMLAALERIVEVEGNGGSAIGMRLIASAAIKAAKGTNND